MLKTLFSDTIYNTIYLISKEFFKPSTLQTLQNCHVMSVKKPQTPFPGVQLRNDKFILNVRIDGELYKVGEFSELIQAVTAKQMINNQFHNNIIKYHKVA